jgi:hypothetical protein
VPKRCPRGTRPRGTWIIRLPTLGSQNRRPNNGYELFELMIREIMKLPNKSVAPIPKHHPIAKILRTSGPRRPARCGLSMEFRSGAKPRISTNKPADSSLLRTRAILWDTSGSFGIPTAYRACQVCAGVRRRREGARNVDRARSVRWCFLASKLYRPPQY